MKKRSIRLLAMLLIVSLVLSSVSFAANRPAEEIQSSKYLTSYSGKIVPTGGGKFNVEFKVLGTGVMTKIGASRIVIYKNDTIIEHIWYTDPGRSGMMGYNCILHADTESYSGVSGAKYYAVIYFYATNQNGSDAKTYKTATVTV